MFKRAVYVYLQNQKKIRQYAREDKQLKQVVDLPLRFGGSKDATVGGADLPTDRPTDAMCPRAVLHVTYALRVQLVQKLVDWVPYM